MEKTFNIADGKGQDATRRVSVTIANYPDNLADLAEKYGEDVVLNIANRGIVIQAQAHGRVLLRREGDDRLNDKAVVNEMAAFQPTIGRETLSDAERFKRAAAKTGMTPEQMIALLKK